MDIIKKISDKKEAMERFNVYAAGVKRLRELEKELESLHTAKFEKEEEKIRAKLKNVSQIAEIEQDLKNLRMKIAGIDPDSFNKDIDEKQNKNITRVNRSNHKLAYKIKELEEKIELNKKRSRNKNYASQIKNLQRKVNFLRNLLEISQHQLRDEEEEIEAEIEKQNKLLPKIQRKASFLSKLFKKDKNEIEEISQKIDKNRLDFNKKLAFEIADAKRMIEEEKFEIRKQLIDTLAEYIHEVNKHKDDSDKAILGEIEKLREKVEEDKKNTNQNLLSKIVQLKSKLDYNKRELKEQTEKQIAILRAENERNLEKMTKIELKEKELEKVKKINEEKQKNDLIKYNIESVKSILEEKKAPIKIEKKKFADLFPDFKPIHEPEIFTFEPYKISDYDKKDKKTINEPQQIQYLKQKINPKNFVIEDIEEKQEKALKSDRPKKIPNKKFLNKENFLILTENLKELKINSNDKYLKIKKDIENKKHLDYELLMNAKNLEIIKKNFSVISKIFRLK
jgi:uncharacterized protein YjiS (DUF1127 family)